MAVAGVEAKLLANTVPYCILNRFLPTSRVEWTYSLVTQPIPCFLISAMLICSDCQLDELLTLASDADCSSLVKMLVAAIAGCNHAPEAQTSIVTEVRTGTIS